jgi:hypothetical protein
MLSILLSSWLSGQTQTQPATDGDQARTVAEVSENTTTQAVVTKVIRDTGMSAGVATVENTCTATPHEFYVPKGIHISDAMDNVIATDGHHKWQLFANGVVMVIPKDGIPALLLTKISRVHISNRKNLTLAVDELLRTDEIKLEVAGKKAFVKGPEPGFQKLQKPTSQAVEEPIDLTDVSLIEALNVLASGQMNSVWFYNERDCAGRKIIQLDFVGK